MLKTLKPSRSSRARASCTADASTVRVTISPAGVPKRQTNSAIAVGVYQFVLRASVNELSVFKNARWDELFRKSLVRFYVEPSAADSAAPSDMRKRSALPLSFL